MPTCPSPSMLRLSWPSLRPIPPCCTCNPSTTSILEFQFFNPISSSPAQDALYLLPETHLITIGRNDGLSHHYKLLTHADLASCAQCNHIFLCVGHKVLRTDLEGSCLGSLYLQSQVGVRENCKLERKQLSETLFQLRKQQHPFNTSSRNHEDSASVSRSPNQY